MTEPSPDQLDLWISTFRGPLVGLLASWGLDWTAAEETAQDALAEAWVSRSRYAGDPADMQAAGAWVRGIAFHLCRERQRKGERARAVSLPEQLEQPNPESPGDAHEQLRVAFARLSESHQLILRMHYLEETSAREVAALLGTTPKAVEDRLYQARKALRELVQRRQQTGARS
jgi:RNA polymerase sigma-70 factor (ECF subfamily)